MYEIKCCDHVKLAQICAELVREGVCFKADTNKLVVTLTGGC